MYESAMPTNMYVYSVLTSIINLLFPTGSYTFIADIKLFRSSRPLYTMHLHLLFLQNKTSEPNIDERKQYHSFVFVGRIPYLRIGNVKIQ